MSPDDDGTVSTAAGRRRPRRLVPAEIQMEDAYRLVILALTPLLVMVARAVILPSDPGSSPLQAGSAGGAALLAASTAPAVTMVGWRAGPWPSNQGRVPAFAVPAESLLLLRGLYLLAPAFFVVPIGSFLLGRAAAGADAGCIVVERVSRPTRPRPWYRRRCRRPETSPGRRCPRLLAVRPCGSWRRRGTGWFYGCARRMR